MKKYYLYLFLVNAYWGITTVFMKYSLLYMSSYTYVGLRMTSGALIILLTFHKWLKDIKGYEIKQGIILGILLALKLEAQMLALRYTSSINMVFLLHLNIITVPLVELIIRKKKPDKLLLFAITGCFCGLVVLSDIIGNSFNVGDLVAVVAMLIDCALIMATNQFTQKTDPQKLIGIELAASSIVSMSISFISGFEIEWCFNSVFFVLMTGVIGTGVAYTLINISEKYIEPTVTSFSFLLDSIFTIFGVMLIADPNGTKETVTVNQLIGSTIILGTLIIYIAVKNKVESEKVI